MGKGVLADTSATLDGGDESGEQGEADEEGAVLAEMDAIIPWVQLLELIEPHYPKAGNGRPPLGLEKMLRIYFLQIWFNLSDPGVRRTPPDSRP